MANRTIYPYGTGGQLPSGIQIVNDRTTGGADKAWSAQMGKELSAQVDGMIQDGADSDFAIGDEGGYQIAQFVGGHIKTKEFDSSVVPKQVDEESIDFGIGDQDGNLIMKIKDGHIETKKFNSSSIDSTNSADLYQKQGNPFGFESSKYFQRSAKKKDFGSYVPLIIVAGQSNADGRVAYTSAPSWLSSNNYAINNFMVWDTASSSFKTYNVRGMTGNGGAIAGSDGTGDNKYAFDAHFAHEFLQDNSGKLFMVRQTLGATGLQNQPTTGTRNWTWQPDVDNIVTGCNSMCLALMEKVIAAYDYANGNGIKLLPVAILWHQGENDATSDRIGYFKQNTSNLVMWIRGLFHAPSLPFINADVNPATEYHAQVNTIFHELNEDDPYMATVDMTGHFTTQDGTHFDAAAIQYMGEQMYDLFKSYQ